MFVMTDGISNLVFQEWNCISAGGIDNTRDLFWYRIGTFKIFFFLYRFGNIKIVLNNYFIGNYYLQML